MRLGQVPLVGQNGHTNGQAYNSAPKSAKYGFSGMLAAPKQMGAESTPEAVSALGPCIAGGIVLLSLIVLPLLLD